MQLTWQTKKNIDIILPVLLTAVAGVVVFKRTKDVRKILLILLACLLLSYVLVSQVTKHLYNGVGHDAKLPGDVDNPDSPCADYDPTALCDALHEDITCIACFRNKDPYMQLLALDNCSFTKVWNQWKNKYSGKVGQSLPLAISDESSFWDSDFGVLQSTLAQKFASLNLS